MLNVFSFLFKRSNKIYRKSSFIIYIAINLSILTIFGVSYFFYYQNKKIKDFSIEKLTLLSPVHSSTNLSSFYFLKKLQPILTTSQKNQQYLENQLKQKLLENNIFNFLKIKTSKHNKSITIKYHLKKPIAYLGNLSNTFLDKNGKTFPATPFFLPQKLPKIFSNSFNSKEQSINEKEALLISKILSYELPIKIIDLSKLFYPSSEIILTLYNEDIIRLTEETFEEMLNYYQYLKRTLYKNSANQTIIFDFRIKGIAFTKIIN